MSRKALVLVFAFLFLFAIILSPVALAQDEEAGSGDEGLEAAADPVSDGEAGADMGEGAEATADEANADDAAGSEEQQTDDGSADPSESADSSASTEEGGSDGTTSSPSNKKSNTKETNDPKELKRKLDEALLDLDIEKRHANELTKCAEQRQLLQQKLSDQTISMAKEIVLLNTELVELKNKGGVGGTYEERLAKLHEEINRLKTERQAQDQKIAQLKQETDRLRERNTAVESAKNAAETNLLKIIEERNHCINQRNHHMQRANSLDIEVNSLKGKINTLNTEKDSLNRQLTSCMSAKAGSPQLKLEFTTCDNERKALTQKNQQLVDMRTKLQQELDKMITERNRLKTERDNIATKASSVANELLNLKKEKASFEKDCERDRSNMANIALERDNCGNEKMVMETRINALKTEASELKKEINTLIAEKLELDKQISTCSRGGDETTRMMIKQCAEERSRISTDLTKVRISERSLNARIERVNAEKDELIKSMDNIKAKLTYTENELDIFKKAKQECDVNADKQVNTIKQDIIKASSEKEKCLLQVKNLEAETASIKTKLEQTEGQVKVVSGERTSLNDQLQRCIKNKVGSQEFASLFHTCNQERSKLLADVLKTTTTRIQVQGDLSKVSFEKNTCTAEKLNLEARVRILENEVDTVQKSSNTQSQKCQSDMNSLRASINILTNERNACATDRTNIASRLNVLTNQANRCATSSSEVQSELTSYKQQIHDLKKLTAKADYEKTPILAETPTKNPYTIFRYSDRTMKEATTAGFLQLGIAFYAYKKQAPETVAIYLETPKESPNTNFFLSDRSEEEAGKYGWSRQGLAFYAYKKHIAGTIPIYCETPIKAPHSTYYFSSRSEDEAKKAGWKRLYVAFYAFPTL